MKMGESPAMKHENILLLLHIVLQSSTKDTYCPPTFSILQGRGLSGSSPRLLGTILSCHFFMCTFPKGFNKHIFAGGWV